MAIPPRSFTISTQNARVEGVSNQAIETNSENQSEKLINDCYRQVFFHLLENDREVYLESQLRNNSITVRDFIRGLFLSDRFRRGYVECNNNYRLAEQVVARAFGRKVYNGAEGLALSIIIAEKGFNYFIDYVLDSDEYMKRFGYDIPPSEVSRLLPGRATGSVPLYQQYPRYDFDWQKKLISNKLMMSIADHLLFSNKTSIEKLLYDKPTGRALKLWLLTLATSIGISIWIILAIFRSTFTIN
ncbi:phycobilisome rod-core linker polypeptide [Synechococcus sp. CC9311]|uniref:phycobilisome rod-core linker polypeptide n=1 Tax=Synechococcus sp. (strain CC9311) TaxID=64471 RepID=UPI0000DDADD1|nr:phycobilisome rod-core linker polypeptide [Synechococcus sp. CC9311]ABI46511.1 possible phycobilisome rod-core linker polypeptide (L-RC 28.5) [Synechococcus sp. CC9311]